jgi:uncharacterized protein YggE
MSKNFTLLSISAALLISLFSVGVGQAVQIDWKKQARIKVSTNAQTTHVPNTAVPCGGRNAVVCKVETTAQTTQVSNAANPCGGRNTAACKKHSLRESTVR